MSRSHDQEKSNCSSPRLKVSGGTASLWLGTSKSAQERTRGSTNRAMTRGWGGVLRDPPKQLRGVCFIFLAPWVSFKTGQGVFAIISLAQYSTVTIYGVDTGLVRASFLLSATKNLTKSQSQLVPPRVPDSSLPPLQHDQTTSWLDSAVAPFRYCTCTEQHPVPQLAQEPKPKLFTSCAAHQLTRRLLGRPTRICLSASYFHSIPIASLINVSVLSPSCLCPHHYQYCSHRTMALHPFVQP